jgi:predicted transcriptional regulator
LFGGKIKMSNLKEEQNTFELAKNQQVIEATGNVCAAIFKGMGVSWLSNESACMKIMDKIYKYFLQKAEMVKGAKIPAVPIEQSVTDDFIFCLEDGEPCKILKKHIAKKYGMNPDQYRNKWGLDSKYPMVAKNYSLQRKELAIGSQLGQNKSTGRKSASGRA